MLIPQNNKGTILMLVVVSAFILSIVGLGTINLMGMQEIQARAELDVVRAQHVAEAGLEYAKAWVHGVCLPSPITEVFPENHARGYVGHVGSNDYELGQTVLHETKQLDAHGGFEVSITPAPDNSINLSPTVGPSISSYGTYLISSTATITSGAITTRQHVQITYVLKRSELPKYYVVPGFVSERGASTVTSLADGTVLIAGGDDTPNGGGEINLHSVKTATIFDPKGNNGMGKFSDVGDMHSPRAEHTACLLPDGTVLIAGGYDNSPYPGNELDSMELYHPDTKSFELLTEKLTFPRSCLNSLFLPSTTTAAGVTYPDQVLILNGRDAAMGYFCFPDVELYDVASRRIVWRSPDRSSSDLGAGGCARMITGRHCATPVVLLDGRVLMAGGKTNPDGDPFCDADDTHFDGHGTNDVEIFDRTKLHWNGSGYSLNNADLPFKRIGNMSAPRIDLGAIICDEKGRVLLLGGHTDGGDDPTTSRPTADIFDPATNSIINVVDEMSDGRADMYLYRSKNNVVISGGAVTGRINGGTLTLMTSKVEVFTPNVSNPAAGKFKMGESSLAEEVQSELNQIGRLPNGSYLMVGGWSEGCYAKTAQVVYYPIESSVMDTSYSEGAVTRGIQ